MTIYIKGHMYSIVCNSQQLQQAISENVLSIKSLQSSHTMES